MCFLLAVNNECNNDLDCAEDEACVGTACVNPCVGVCEDEYTYCYVFQHKPYCHPTQDVQVDYDGTEQLLVNYLSSML